MCTKSFLQKYDESKFPETFNDKKKSPFMLVSGRLLVKRSTVPNILQSIRSNYFRIIYIRRITRKQR